jgi:hypothetical protein
LSPDPTPNEIADGLTAFYCRSKAEKDAIRETAHRECLADWDVNKLTEEVAGYLKS